MAYNTGPMGCMGYGNGAGGGYGYDSGGGGGSSYYDPRMSNRPSWGYIILYLTILCGSLVGNFVFCMIIKKCPNLHRTHHFFFLAIAMMDIFVCLLTLPFIMDSHGKKLNWKLPEYLCKFYMFADFSLKGVHAYLLLLGAIFLYFHYRKNESYATETGEVRTRGSKMHKWAIPLAWVLGLGIGVPAGAMATMDTCGRCELWHSMDGQGRHRPAQGSEANILLAFLVGGFIVPVVLMLMPLIALFMQLCGGRTPRLDPPHSRTALLMVILMVLFISSRAPHDIYELMKMYSNQFGNRGNAYRMYGPSVELDCMVYIPMLLHPILFILLQPEYRQGFRDMMRSCGGSSTPQAENPYGEGRQRRLVPPQSSIIRGGGGRRGQQQNGHGQLIHERQPMIVAAPGGMAGHNRTHQGQLMQGSAYIQQQGMQQGMQGMRMSPQSQPLLQQGQLDNSFEMQQQDPSLPARFTTGKFQYIDTARVEPKIAYTPTNTPPKTPQVPHFDMAPFKQPNYVDGVWNYPGEQEAYTGSMPAHMIPIDGFINPDQQMPVVEKPASPPPDEPMEIECLDSSPGNTIRSSRRGRPLEGPPGVNRLQASPGAKRRNDGGRLEDAPAKRGTNGVTNGHGSQPASPTDPHGPGQTVEITLQGRSRSRQDLCPDVPRPKSRFEHAV